MSAFAQILISDARSQLIELHWKIVMLHLARQHVAQREMRAFRSVNFEVIVRLKQRREKRKALNVIPMCVREEDGGRDRPRRSGH